MKRIIKDDIIEAGVLTLLFAIIFIGSNLLYEIAISPLYTGLGFENGYITVSGKSVGHHIFMYIFSILVSFIVMSYVFHRLLWDERKRF